MIGAFAAALGGLDALVFAGGIGENCLLSAPASARVWDFLGSDSKKTEQKKRSDYIKREEKCCCTCNSYR